MLLNYIRTAWRNFCKHTLYSVINISGLAIGLAVCMLIMLYVAHEMSFDRFHQRSGRIFDVYARIAMGADTVQLPFMTYQAGPSVKEHDARVEDFLRLRTSNRPAVIRNAAQPAIKLSEKKFHFADSNFFRFFTFPLLKGDPAHALDRPFTVVLSKSAAARYFGKDEPVGKVLRYEGIYDFEVTGVSEDVPSNSTITYDFVASLSSFLKMDESQGMLKTPNVGIGAFKTYFLLKDPRDADAVSRTMQQLSAQGKDKSSERYVFTGIKNMHLSANFGDFSNLRYLKIFPLVAGLILLLALINYMSLATARATLRAKEVGVRKTLGAGRAGLARQFYVESGLYAVLAFVLGVLIFLLVKPVFYQQLSLHIDTSFLLSPVMLGIGAGLLMITIFIAGSYPALVLSSFKPVSTLAGKLSRRSGGASIRKVFTVLQFSISIALIVCGLVIDRQLDFFRHTDTGVNRTNIIMVPFAAAAGDHYNAFRNDVSAIAGVRQTAMASFPMYGGYNCFFTENAETKEQVMLPVYHVDSAFIPMLGLQWKQAPAYAELLTQGNKVAVNETTIQKLGLPANPIGSFLHLGNDQYEVVGVLKDFSYASLHRKVDALSLFVSKDTASTWRSAGGCLFVKTTAGANMPTLLAAIRKSFEKYDDNNPFKYQFMDDAYDAMYKAEDRLARIFSIFTGLTVLIACLGLFGLAAFMAEQRTKEIGVRKVLGASVGSIVGLLGKDFIKLVLIAILLATPVAWYLMHGWLQDFAYRIHMQWWMFAVSAAAALLLAWITVGIQSVKAALTNPIKALRTE